MKIVKVCAIIITLALAAISCEQGQTQAPIFYSISTETAPIPPLIEGSPTNMVKFERNGKPVLYVASGSKLYWYADPNGEGKPRWNASDYGIPQPSGKILSLAVAKNAGNDRLYALCMSGTSTRSTLGYYEEATNKWEYVTNRPDIQSIYADPTTNRLFAGTGSGDSKSYSIWYLDGDEFKLLRSGISLLSGVVSKGSTYYLSTRGDGIFKVEDSLGTLNVEGQLTDTSTGNKNDSRMFMGMIKLEDDTIIAVERNGGALYEVETTGIKRMRHTKKEMETDDDGNEIEIEKETDDIAIGRYTTGALALWQNDATPPNKLLIVGIQGNLYSTTTSSYTYGYVEFELNSNDGSFNTESARHDAGGLQSVLSTDQYTSSLGKHPVNHLLQAPHDIDSNMTFFASTQNTGLWSYRDRPSNGGLQWNAEQ